MFRIFVIAVICAFLIPAAYAEEAELNVLLFVSADDFVIYSDTRREMNQMEEIGSDGRVGMFVEIGNWPRNDVNEAGANAWYKSRANFPADYAETKRFRYKIEKDNDRNNITNEPVVKDIPYNKEKIHEHIMDFVTWVHETSPAKTYMLIFGGHGGGDFGGPGAISNIDLGLAFENLSNYVSTTMREKNPEISKRLKVIAFDSCLMQTIGVAYQSSKRDLQSILGSSNPIYGVDFKDFITTLKSKDDCSDVKTISEVFVDAFYNYANSARFEKAQIVSAVNAKKLKEDKGTVNDLKKLVQNFVKVFLAEAGKNDNQIKDDDGTVIGNKYWHGIRAATARSQRFDKDYYEFVDMVDFFEIVKIIPFYSNDVKDAANKILDHLKGSSTEYNDKKIIMKYRVNPSKIAANDKYFDDPELDNAKGVSILLPAPAFSMEVKNGKTLSNVAAAFKSRDPATINRVMAVNDDGTLKYYQYGTRYIKNVLEKLDFGQGENSWLTFIEEFGKYNKQYAPTILDAQIINFKNITSSGGGKYNFTGHVGTEKHSGISHKEFFE